MHSRMCIYLLYESGFLGVSFTLFQILLVVIFALIFVQWCMLEGSLIGDYTNFLYFCITKLYL